MKPHQEAYLLFFVSLAAMLTIGLVLQGWDSHFGLVGTELVCVLLPAVVFRWLWRNETEIDWASYRRLGMHPKWLVWVAATAAIIGLGANVLTGLLIEMVPSLRPMAEAYEESVWQLLNPDDPVRRAVGIFSIVVMAPLCEEVLFRGTILPAQRSSGAKVTTVIVLNGFLFSLLHVNPLTFIALIAVGAYFAHLVVLTESVWPAIFAHAVLNGVNGVVAPALIDPESASVVEPSLGALLGAGAVVIPLAAGLWIFGARRLDRQGSHD